MKKELITEYLIPAILIIFALYLLFASAIGIAIYRLNTKVDTVTDMQEDTLDQMYLHRLESEEIEEEPTNIAVKPHYYLTEEDRDIVTRVVMAEAGNDFEGCLAVAQTIHDRACLWNMEVSEIVTQDSQFASPKKDNISDYPNAVLAVSKVFDEGEKAFADANVTHFHAEGTNPYWVEGKTYEGSRGGNRFYS